MFLGSPLLSHPKIQKLFTKGARPPAHRSLPLRPLSLHRFDRYHCPATTGLSHSRASSYTTARSGVSWTRSARRLWRRGFGRSSGSRPGRWTAYSCRHSFLRKMSCRSGGTTWTLPRCATSRNGTGRRRRPTRSDSTPPTTGNGYPCRYECTSFHLTSFHQTSGDTHTDYSPFLHHPTPSPTFVISFLQFYGKENSKTIN